MTFIVQGDNNHNVPTGGVDYSVPTMQLSNELPGVNHNSPPQNAHVRDVTTTQSFSRLRHFRNRKAARLATGQKLIRGDSRTALINNKQ